MLPLLFFNYTEAQSYLCLPIVMNLLKEGKAVIRCKKELCESYYREVQELIFLSFLFQLSESEENKLKVTV